MECILDISLTGLVENDKIKILCNEVGTVSNQRKKQTKDSIKNISEILVNGKTLETAEFHTDLSIRIEPGTVIVQNLFRKNIIYIKIMLS